MKNKIQLLILLFPYILSAQPSNKAVAKIVHEFLLVGFDNYLQVVALQEQPVSKSQVFATLYSYEDSTEVIESLHIEGDNGHFMIHPNRTGLVIFNIILGKDTIWSKFYVKEVRAIASINGWRNVKKVKAEKIHLVEGILALTEGYDICGKCRVLNSEVIRISIDGQVFKVNNLGERFNSTTIEILKMAQKNDIYIFRNIKYRCYSNRQDAYSEDITIDLE